MIGLRSDLCSAVDRRLLLLAWQVSGRRICCCTPADRWKWFQTRPTSKGFLTHLGMFKPLRLFAFQIMMHFCADDNELLQTDHLFLKVP